MNPLFKSFIDKFGRISGALLGFVLVFAWRGGLGNEAVNWSHDILILGLFALAWFWCIPRFPDVLRKVRARLPRLEAAIQRWHAGQLAIFWIGVGLTILLLLGSLRVIPTSTVRSQAIHCATTECPPSRAFDGSLIEQTKLISVPEPHPIGDRWYGMTLILLLGVPPLALGVTWVWFGGRVRHET
jgi:hypothetical protein